MDRISVNVGQFVLTGEPIAIMIGGALGNGSQAAATQVTANFASGADKPVLYVEFRKDGAPIDPSPWWAASKGEKVRG
jgi:septal ring factor EnvC (AmiA/AmiB activator)